MLDFERIAWMGGTSPRPIHEITDRELEMTFVYLKEQLLHYCYYWNEDPSPDVLNTLWNRARHDAHASFRTEVQNAVS